MLLKQKSRHQLVERKIGLDHGIIFSPLVSIFGGIQSYVMQHEQQKLNLSERVMPWIEVTMLLYH